MRGPGATLTLILLVAVGVLGVRCSPSQQTTRTGQTEQSSAGRKTLTVGISNSVNALSIVGSSTTAGGWQSLNELHSDGLVTSGADSQTPVARLAAQVPSLDNRLIQILPDGTMTTTYPLRHDVSWQDGVPFTASDMAFAYQVDSDSALPFLNRDAIHEMQSVEATDDYTVLIHWKAPYYQADSVGLRALWPQPRHILEQDYQAGDPTAFVNLPYWTTEYVHLGPFRLTDFQAGISLTFAAYDGYFLGRPKLDQVVVKIFNDENVLYSSILAGAVDMIMDNSLGPDRGLKLKDEWDRSGDGTVFVGTGTTRFISPQFNPSVLQQSAVLNPTVRQALMYALDRGALSATMQDNHAELIANSLLPPSDRLYDAVQNGWAQYTHDPARATALMSQAGWTPGADGVLIGSDGSRFTTSLWTTEGSDNEIAAVADYWKQIGVVADQHIVGGAEVRDRQLRTQYPGFETSARGSGDSILSRVETQQAGTAANHYSGSNRGDYSNPQLDQLISQYRGSVDVQSQGSAIKAVSDLMADQLPVMLLYFNPTTPAVRKSINALSDFKGGSEASRLYGTFSRDASQWDLKP